MIVTKYKDERKAFQNALKHAAEADTIEDTTTRVFMR